MKSWVEKQTNSIRYSNVSDYIRDLIRKDQIRQEATAILQAAITEGIESGKPEALNVEEFKRSMRKKHGV